jgi:sulfate transport system permease protein
MSSRIGLRIVALGYLALLLVIPVGVVFYRTFEHGVGAVIDSVTTPAAISAFWLTVEVAAIAVPLNVVFGIATALVLVRGRFPGKRLLDTLIDLPFAVSPVVIGLALLLLYGRDGWFGSVLLDHGIRVLFSVPPPLGRPSGASRCRRSAGASPTASCCRSRARSASSARSAS